MLILSRAHGACPTPPGVLSSDCISNSAILSNNYISLQVQVFTSEKKVMGWFSPSEKRIRRRKKNIS